MFNMILKRALIVSMPVFGANADAGISKELLANHCYELSETVTSLVASQQKSTCIDKLYTASMQMHTAAELILDDSSSVARPIMDNAVFALQFAELNGCNRYIQISHSKLEANKLKRLL